MLEIIKTSTLVISSSKHVTASLIVPTKVALLSQLNRATYNDESISAYVVEVKQRIINDLEDR